METLIKKLAKTMPVWASVLSRFIRLGGCGEYPFPVNVANGFVSIKPVIQFLLCLTTNEEAYATVANAKKGERLPSEDSPFWQAEKTYMKLFPRSAKEFDDRYHLAVLFSAVELIWSYQKDIERRRVIWGAEAETRAL